MAIIELEPVTDETVGEERGDEDDDSVAHLLKQDGNRGLWVTECGAPNDSAHRTQHGTEYWKPGMFACPACGVPLCMDCILAAS